MNKKCLLAAFCVLSLFSCNNQKAQSDDLKTEPTQYQQQMLDNGWVKDTPDEDMSETYGVESAYGIQDNYLDITIGKGCDMAVKIIDCRTDKCIRYVYVAECSTTTVQQIPQGKYYLKFTFGNDWMSLDEGGKKVGRFTRHVSYERSLDTFDFGIKNSTEERNFSLEINIVDNKLYNNFLTTSISEEEFFK